MALDTSVTVVLIASFTTLATTLITTFAATYNRNHPIADEEPSHRRPDRAPPPKKRRDR